MYPNWNNNSINLVYPERQRQAFETLFNPWKPCTSFNHYTICRFIYIVNNTKEFFRFNYQDNFWINIASKLMSTELGIDCYSLLLRYWTASWWIPQDILRYYDHHYCCTTPHSGLESGSELSYLVACFCQLQQLSHVYLSDFKYASSIPCKIYMLTVYNNIFLSKYLPRLYRARLQTLETLFNPGQLWTNFS